MNKTPNQFSASPITVHPRNGVARQSWPTSARWLHWGGMALFLIAFAVSAAVTLLLVRSSRAHQRYSGDTDLAGPQKFHVGPVPRIGGVGIAMGLLAGVVVMFYFRRFPGLNRELAFWLCACCVPVFVAGLLEDITKNVPPRYRMAVTALSALAAALLLGATIDRTDLSGLDWIASYSLGAVCLAVFTVAGVANAVNIIDGFNGLASMCVLMMLLAITYVAVQVGDSSIAMLALVGAGAVLGFFIWNFPAGLIFLGDGGAYFLGFFVAELSILLIKRNAEVSPLFPLLMCIYPVFETLFSMYRRRFVQGRAMGLPDGVHLHSLVYRRLLRWAVGSRDAKMLTRRNSMTAPYLWLLCLAAVVPSVVWWDSSMILGIFIVLFGVSYVFLYASILRFKAPRWLVLTKR